jgi:hypothetical protein
MHAQHQQGLLIEKCHILVDEVEKPISREEMERVQALLAAILTDFQTLRLLYDAETTPVALSS